MRKIELVPSLLSADFSKIGEEIRAVEEAGAKRLHLDVMDGHFVPNITIGPIIVEAVRRITSLHLESHLMIESPSKFLRAFMEAGSDTILFHIEADKNPEANLKLLEEKGIRAGLVINPETSLEAVEPFFSIVDQILVMTVHPGFGGQKMIKECLEKVEVLRKIKDEKDYRFLIEVDGGVNKETIGDVVRAGADLIVAGSAIFVNRHPGDDFATLKGIIDEEVNKG